MRNIMRKLLVIDLDQTVIDSSIRENYCYEKGELDLPKYRQIKTCPDNGIVNDCLTPFGEWLKVSYYSLLEKGYTLIFLTARLCDKLDVNSFRIMGLDSMLLDHCLLIDRSIATLYGGDSNEQDSGKYKKPICHYLARAYNTYNIVVIDDCHTVLSMAKEQGFIAICARELYHYDNSDFDALFTF